MRSQIWKQMVWVFCLLFLMESCVKHDIYQGEDPSVDPQEPTKEKEDYIAQFENFENIQVSISSQHEEKNIGKCLSNVARHHSDTFPGIVNGTSNDIHRTRSRDKLSLRRASHDAPR